MAAQEGVAAVVDHELGAVDRPASRVTVSGGAIPSKRPASTSVGTRSCQPIPRVVIAARQQLAARPSGPPSPAPRRASAPCARGPRVVDRARVQQLDHALAPRRRVQRVDLVERVGAAARAPRRRDGEHEPVDAVAGRQRQLLGDHAAERDPDHREAVPVQVVGERQRIGGEVAIVGGSRRGRSTAPARGGRRPRRRSARRPATRTARAAARVAARPADDQQPRSGARALVVQGDVGQLGGRHGAPGYRPGARRPRRSTAAGAGARRRLAANGR